MVDGPSHDRTIFIVDDDPAIRGSVSFLAGTLGLRLAMESFSSATDFIDHVDTRAVSASACLIVDARMPGISGVERVEQLIARGKRFAFLIISGHGNESLRQRAEELGAVAFLEKPFLPSLLKDAIGRAFGL